MGGTPVDQDQPEPELVASPTPRRDLSAIDVEYLQEVIAAAARRFRTERGS